MQLKNIITLFMIAELAVSCHTHSNPNIHYIDTSKFLIDTVYKNVLIGNRKYSIYIVQNKLNSQQNKLLNNNKKLLAISILDVQTQEEKYFNLLDTKEINTEFITELHKLGNASTDGKGAVIFSVITYYGGSGSTRTTYLIKNIGNKFFLQKIFTVEDELSYSLENIKTNSLLLMEGIWNMEEAETHFSDHRMKVKKYFITEDTALLQTSFTTLYKYPVIDNDSSALEVVKKMKLKENGLRKKIDY